MDKQKADELLISYLPKLFGFAMKKSFSYAEAEELCSEMVAELYESLLKAKEIYNPDGYVRRIAAHVYARYVSAVRRRRGVSIDGLALGYEEEYDFGEAEQEILRLRREIAFLARTRREIVYAYYFENQSVARIAHALRMPEGTVKWHLHQARNDLKEGLEMERKIGKLGLKPIRALSIRHSGGCGPNGGPECYIGDNLNLNLVYSVYRNPKTVEEMAGELGVTPVLIEDRVAFLEDNGFLVRQAGGRYTTYVKFSPESYSLERQEHVLKKQLAIARRLAEEYVPAVRAAVSDVREVWIPGKNRELLEAAAVFYGVANKCCLPVKRDLSPYQIRTQAGGHFIAFVELPAEQTDPDYVPTLQLPSMWTCGDMNRWSGKYPVEAWSVDTRYCSRTGGWEDNWTSDYEYLYEFITGAIADNRANEEKFRRLRKRGYLSEDNRVQVMVVKGSRQSFFDKIPGLEAAQIDVRQIADEALELAQTQAEEYPPQMRDLVIAWNAGGFISNTVALMVLDCLYESGAFRPLTEPERVTSQLLVFSDTLPNA